ncbi:helix-turn-helix domain-containing protein [Streptomyces sp. SUK 48]|uniref:helix-turn-helix domain-containing protein n=1 Tax=Streptomyces sp. SUK 48 TaxID=2582831 RepID=UPI00129A950A|nr:helix-turn-helix domain-containing protein [Streptomyces sp. SUK 48]
MAQQQVRYCSCGTRLARDNRGTLCASCLRRRETTAVNQPPQVPVEFWQDDRLREALASWHMGQVFYAYRVHPWHSRVVSQETLAGWLGLTQAQLSRIESASTAPQDLGKLMSWAHGLNIPGDLLWFKLRREPLPVQPTPEHTEHPARKVLLDMITPGGDWLPLSNDAPEYGVSGLRGMSLQATGEHLLRTFLHLDDELGGDSLYVPLTKYVARMAVSVKANPGDGLAAYGQLNQMVGWLSLDASRHAHAKRYFATAVEIGHEVGDPGLVASALGYMSLQETYRGRPQPARSLAQMAFAVTTDRLTPLTKTVMGARLARAHASLGDEQCLRVLDTVQADFALAGTDEEPPYVLYVDAVEVAAQRGACYLDLGMADEAITSLSEALDLLSTSAPNRARDRVHYLSRLAKCYLLDGEVERACQVGHDALALSQTIGSARITERLGELDTALAPYGQLSYVQEFKELFRLVTADDT